MVNSPSGFNTLDQQIPQNSTVESKFYINRKTGDIVDSVDPNETANYIETDPRQVLYVDIQKEFSDGSNAISTTPVMGGKVMSSLQYAQYKKAQQDVENLYATSSIQDKHKIIWGVMKTIVDSEINFPAGVSDNQKLKMYAMIKAMGQSDAQTILNNKTTNSTTSSSNSDQAQIDALMKKLNGNTEENIGSAESKEQDNDAPKGFFKIKMHRKDTGLFWWPRSAGNTTQIINDKEYQGPTMMLSGNGFSFKKARTNVLLNKMITKLEGNDPDAVMKELFGFTTRGFGMGRRFLHEENLINTFKNPKKFDARFQIKLTEYVQHRLRNLPQGEQQAIIQAIINAKNAYAQQHIHQVQNIMTNADLSSLARQYNPN